MNKWKQIIKNRLIKIKPGYFLSRKQQESNGLPIKRRSEQVYCGNLEKLTVQPIRLETFKKNLIKKHSSILICILLFY